MSGGSYDYNYSTVRYTYCKKMYDTELNEMMEDLVELLYQLEWWQSGDTNEEDYRKTVNDFKKKWFKRNKTQVKDFIEKQFEEKKNKLYRELKYWEE